MVLEAPPPNPTLSIWGKKFIFVWNDPCWTPGLAILVPFGPLWNIKKPAMFVHFWSKMDCIWAFPSHELWYVIEITIICNWNKVTVVEQCMHLSDRRHFKMAHPSGSSTTPTKLPQKKSPPLSAQKVFSPLSPNLTIHAYRPFRWTQLCLLLY